MTPRERAEAEPLELAQRLIDRIRPALMSNLIDDTLRLVIATEITTMLAEHVRALLADDEATIEMMARALVIRTAEHYGDLLPIDLDLSLTKLLARAVLAALRRKALVGALH